MHTFHGERLCTKHNKYQTPDSLAPEPCAQTQFVPSNPNSADIADFSCTHGLETM